MAFSRRLGVIGILGASWLLAVACGSDDDKKVSNAGEAGEAGESAGGTPSSGGSSSNAGKSGGGAAGKGGNGGSSAGGNAVAGGGGGGGMPSEGGAAGATEVPLGGMPTAGAGASGEGGMPAVAALSCDYQCVNDGDCEIPGPFTDTSHKCNQVTKRCENPDEICSADSDCLAFASEWSVSCADDSGCTADFEACVTSHGKGYCASLPDLEFPEFPCTRGAIIEVPRFGAQGVVNVCGSPDPRCFDGKCAAGCGDPDRGCGGGEGDTCNNDTGRCECATGDECASGACENQRCVGCVTSEQCAATAQFTGLDVCVNGRCGCSASQVCPDGGFESATAVCE
jgi:hypothetical protein